MLRVSSHPLTEPPSDDLGALHPGALLFRAAGHPPSLPTMADALAHGADVNWVNGGQENATPLIQATAAVSPAHCPAPTVRLLSHSLGESEPCSYPSSHPGESDNDNPQTLGCEGCVIWGQTTWV